MNYLLITKISYIYVGLVIFSEMKTKHQLTKKSHGTGAPWDFFIVRVLIVWAAVGPCTC